IAWSDDKRPVWAHPEDCFCSDCEQRRMTMRYIDALFRQSPMLSPPPGFVTRVLQRLDRYGAIGVGNSPL
ncbi:MAG: hypothetical protein KC449_06225, partial [Anaerolineales bacterium]|nr:hypothetical protein [Anaerolineales bacterium]